VTYLLVIDYSVSILVECGLGKAQGKNRSIGLAEIICLPFPQADNQLHDITWESIKIRIIHIFKTYFVQKSRVLLLNCLVKEIDF